MTGHCFSVFDTPLGPCGIVWSSCRIYGVQLPMGSENKTRTHIYQSQGDIEETPPPPDVQNAIDGISELLTGKPSKLTNVVLDLDGVPEFNRCVYSITRTILPGKTLTYGDIAKRLGGVELSGRRWGAIPVRSSCLVTVY